MWTELTQPLFSGRPGAPVSARLCGQAVITASVHGRCPQFLIRHCGQIVCHCGLSVHSQTALKFALSCCGRCPIVYVILFLSSWDRMWEGCPEVLCC